jgi:hypothetical protein
MLTFETPAPISAIVELGVGDLRIVATDRADTVVEVRPSDPAKAADGAAAEQTSVKYADGVLRIEGPKGWRRSSFRGKGQSIDVRIELPTGSRFRGDVGVATLRSSGILGDCHYKAGVGDVTLEKVVGVADLTTATGAVRVERFGSEATIKNSNGATWIGEVAGALHVKSANGSISVDHAGAGVTAKTANGDIHIGEVASGVIVAETALGRVDIAVRREVAAWLDLHTRFGHVDNGLESGPQPGPGEAIVEVRARTSFGDITIRRSDFVASFEIVA